MGKCKTANILEMGCRRAKRCEIWDSGGSLGSICATSGTLANGQVSCSNMAILKIGPISVTDARRAKISSISTALG